MESERLLNIRARIFLLLLASLSFLGAGIFYEKHILSVSIISLITGLVSVILVNRIYNATNEAIIFLFDSLRNDDTSIRFREKIKNKGLRRVYESINRLNKYFQDIKLRNEYNESYYRSLIQNSSSGLIVLSSNNKIELINKTACLYAGIAPDTANPDLLRIRHPEFYDAVSSLRPGETITYKSLVSNNMQLLNFRASMIRRKEEEELKLISIQDIRYELESKELESYRKLISVLTHEIMNILSPLTSVAKELHTLFNAEVNQKKSPSVDDAVIKTAVSGLQLINEQSNSLINFMNNYRKISKLPQPEFNSFSVSEWIEQLKIAYSGRMKESNIAFKISAEKSLNEIIADKKLLNQVMINLINNSHDAVMDNELDRKIEISILKNSMNRIIIKIINNGPVIPGELLEKIFVPFFTTKKGGSGVGLSISQEILKMHNGSIVAISSEQSQTCFILEF
jgi:two-component system, NtrC family, nitrogen regulation sensor histidine kinase NtrY